MFTGKQRKKEKTICVFYFIIIYENMVKEIVFSEWGINAAAV